MGIRDAFRAAPVEVERASVGPSFTQGDPALAEFLGIGSFNDSGETVTELSALGLSAVWRSVQIIAGTIAGLPMNTYSSDAPTREQVPSIFDDPCAPWYTRFEWIERVVAHLALHGNAYLLHVYNAAGQLAALIPVAPQMVSVRWVNNQRVYTVTIPSNQLGVGEQGVYVYSDSEITHIMGLSSDGLRGYSPLYVMRNAFGTSIAGDRAAASMFGNGLLLGGIVSAEGISESQADAIKVGLKNKLGGAKRAGDIAVINAALTFSPWTMNAHDAQFIESRAFQVEEVARLFGVPKVLLAEDGASTWGSGIAQLDRGFAQYTLTAYTRRIEERLGRLLDGQYVCFDFDGLLEGTPQEQAALQLQLVAGGVITPNEARAARNLAPLPGGDELAAAVLAPAKTPPTPGADKDVSV